MSQLVPVAQISFAGGEISPQLWGRVDQAKYRTGAAVMRNMFVDFRGGAANRAGTQIVGPCPDLSDPAVGVGLGSPNPPVLIPFIFNQAQSYMLEFDARGMRVIDRGRYVTKPAKAIMHVSKSSPIVLDMPSHGLTVDSRFYVEDVAGCLRANGISGLNGRIFEVAAVTIGTITLKSPWNFTLSSAAWTDHVAGSGVIKPILEVAAPSYAPLEAVPKRELCFVQSADVLSLSHPLMAPHKVKRLAADNWAIEREAIGPKFKPPSGVKVTKASTEQNSVKQSYIYTYCVSAVNSDSHDESAASDAKSVTMAAVVNDSDYPDATARKIAWDAVAGANLYRIYKCQVTDSHYPPTPPYTWGLIGETEALSYQDTNYAPDYTRAPPTNANPFSNGAVQSIGVVASGFGYRTPMVAIGDSGGTGTGTGAAANAQIDATGAITGINVTTPGTEYAAPNVTISEANFIAGSGATIDFSGAWTASGGVFVPDAGSVTIDSAGAGYHVPEIVGTVGGSGSHVQGAGYGVIDNGALASIVWQTMPSTTDTSSATLTVAATDRAPGWVPDSQAVGLAVLGEQINPRCVTYFQQRKTYGGGGRPTSFWMSRPGLFTNFDVTYPSQDDDAITATIAGPQVNEIVSFTPVSNGLIALTTGGAYLISGGQPAAPVTPSGISSLSQVSSGSALLQPVVMGSDVVYLQSRGTSVRTLSYSFQVDSYQGADISAFSAHLLEGQTIVQWAWAEEPHKLLWSVRGDGVMLSLAYIKEHDVWGWSRHDTQGEFVSVASIPEDGSGAGEDAIYVVVRRIINGGFYYLTERMASRLMGGNSALGIPSDPEQAWFVDSGARYALSEPTADLLAGATGIVGRIAGATVVAGGAGYEADAVVEIVDGIGSGPTGSAGRGSGATASITVSGGVVTGVTIVDAGSNYTAPRLQISGGGSGAIVTFTLQSLQSFSTSAPITAAVGEVLRVGGGKGIVTSGVANGTSFTCTMIVKMPRHLPNTPVGTLAPVLAQAGDWSLTKPVQTIGGLDHLEGQIVLGLADGSLVTPRVVSDGCITLEQPASAIVLGLGYTSQLQTLRMDFENISGRRRIVPSVTLRTVDSRGFFVGPDFKRPGAMIEQKNRSNELYGQPISFETGGGIVPPIFAGMPTAPNPLGYDDTQMNIATSWNKDGYVCIQQSYPLPLTVIEMVPNLVVGDDAG